MKTARHQKLPTIWEKREELRDKGQFWTPDWIAEAMVAYVMRNSDLVFDPGVGKGVFYNALRKYSQRTKFYGTDIDPTIIAEAAAEGILDRSSEIEIRDFILNPPQRLFKSIVANPPYIRHHRLSPQYKDKFRVINTEVIGTKLDGRAGLHIYFLIQALHLLADGGRLAFIMPADTCEGVFAEKLWHWITANFSLEGVITFEHKATPFPDVDTNPIIFLIRKAKPRETITWARCLKSHTSELTELLEKNLISSGSKYDDLIIHRRSMREALITGLSRAPREKNDFRFTLADFARTMRGIATGANEFFFLTEERTKELQIPNEFLLPAIGRTRDVNGDRITQDTIAVLQAKGRPTYLFSPNGMPWEKMPRAVKSYILEGEKMGLSKRALISTRQPWYRMEVRQTPPFLFAYLGRRNTRFIKNEAGIMPLTGFLCVYPHLNESGYTEKLWTILKHPTTIENLQLVGKSYGSGAIKVEPRSLEKLPLNTELIEKTGLQPIKHAQSLFS